MQVLKPHLATVERGSAEKIPEVVTYRPHTKHTSASKTVRSNPALKGKFMILIVSILPLIALLGLIVNRRKHR